MRFEDVVRMWRLNREDAEREFYEELDAEKREGIPVDLWRALPDSGPEG
ncbi:hypothetical protein ACWEPH_21675 [Nocardia beijingensis]